MQRLVTLRHPVSLKTGYNDYRCIIHAHSYLSHDSRGTISEIAAAAKSVGVNAVFLSNHPKQDVDVVAAGQTGAVDGVLFVAGSETNGFLAFPGDGKLPPLDVGEQQFVSSIHKSDGLVFFAHPEEHKDWSISGLTGTEIYNTHADFKDEKELVTALQPKDSKGYGKLLTLLNTMNGYPDEAFAALFDPPLENLAKYDTLCRSRTYAAIAGNDSHQNVGFILKGGEAGKIIIEDPLGEKLGEIDTIRNPAVKAIFGDPIPGKELMRRILDPYPVSFHYVSTHVLAREGNVVSLKEALKSGRTYVAFDWIADPSGAAFAAEVRGKRYTIGDTIPLDPDLTFRCELPLPATIRLIHDGVEISKCDGRTMIHKADEPGVYRFEAYLPVANETRAWIYSGAIRVTPSKSK